MNFRTFGSFSAASVIGIAICSMVSAQELGEMSKYVRVGLGYSLIGETSILGEPLEISAETNLELVELPELPESCFKEPGVTALNGARVEDAKDLLIKSEVVGRSGVDLLVQCGESEAPALPVIQIPLDGEWKRFVNPSLDSINAHIEGSYDLQLKRAGVAMEEDDDPYRIARNRFGGIDFVNSGPLSSGIRFDKATGRYYEAHMLRIISDEFATYAEEALKIAGCDTLRISPEDNYERIVIRGQEIDPSVVLAYGKDMLLMSSSLLILESNISVALLEDAASRHSSRVRTVPDVREIAADLPDKMCSSTFDVQ